MAQSCILVPTSTKIDTITSQSLFTVTSLSSTTSPPTTTKKALVSIGLDPLDLDVIPRELTVVPVTSITTVFITTQQTTTLFGTACAHNTASPSPSSSTTTLATTQASLGIDNAVLFTSSSELSSTTPVAIPVSMELEQSQDTVAATVTPPPVSPSSVAIGVQTNAAHEHAAAGGISKSQMGAIIGGCVAMAALVLVVSALLCFLKRRRKKVEWDGVFRQGWADGESGLQAGSKTQSPEMRAGVVPFPYDAAPTRFYRDPKGINRPGLVYHRPDQSATTFVVPSLGYHQAESSDGRSYTAYPDTETGYGDRDVKQGNRLSQGSDSSKSSLPMGPYGGLGYR
ncbi:hypothetical protein D9756_001257 [Leucocoprinus leucothites]|uniref:Uncharacterized protein n=1 Tax=Leucocoprinus leucothites TaxID=201217 RepID=A0A8H5G4S6_9AGAR|nr:hypothetical protein D9756_001257 [Leucoagaricus leucothites]